MSIITKITKQRRRNERYNIYIDYEYAFSLDAELLIEHKLKEGKEIDEDEISQIVYRDNVRKAYDRSLHYLQYRMRSQEEIENYLDGKGFDPNVIEDVIEKLKEYDFIDDIAFAQAMTNDILSTRQVGRRFIIHKLREKGISDDIIDSITSKLHEQDEFAMAYNLARDQFERLRAEPTIKDEQRIARLMARRGFEWHMINRAIRDAIKQLEN
ncbi:MAG: hypothetical protein GX974_09950 [Clostridiales bacterium]|nr:hypothetical protein [Clostridiales bacterium]